VGAGGQRFHSIQDLEIGIHGNREEILELQFRRGASENIRTVAIRMPHVAVKAA
jgi:hypothetical protein